MAERLVGTNYVTPDIIAKVTGRARYAEDFRADGMLFCKLMLSERPHARVLGIDTRRAMALPGVRAIITADDVPKLGGTAEHCLTNEPLYAGEPILAVAAISEEIAADAIDLIRLDLEPLPFVTDPIESLHPDGPDARTDGNVWGTVIPEPGQPPRRPSPQHRPGQAPKSWPMGAQSMPASARAPYATARPARARRWASPSPRVSTTRR